MATNLSERFLRRVVLSTAVSVVVCISWVDGPFAKFFAGGHPEVKIAAREFTTAVEIAFGFPLSPFLYGAITLALGAVLRMRNHRIADSLLFVGGVHVTARFLADIVKPPFSRLRPHEALTPDGWHDTWFAPVGNSFPSGHAVHFWSLFFALALLFPRYRLPLSVPPVLISLARVAVNDHYLSDVVASAGIAAAITLIFVRSWKGRLATHDDPRK